MPSAIPRTTYEQLSAILEHHVSHITVMSMLSSVLAQRSITPYDVRGGNIVEIVEEVMVGLRLFCDPARLPDLMIELAELCDRETFLENAPPSNRTASILRAATRH